jgi:hypothetical protein
METVLDDDRGGGVLWRPGVEMWRRLICCARLR